MNELVTVEQKNIPDTFKPSGTDALVEKIKAHVKDIVPNVATLKGRKEIASLAAKVAKSKTYLDGLGKDYVAELKEIPKAVDSERKRMRDALDKVRDEVRKPLNDWEEAEEKRVATHEANIAEIVGGGTKALAEWETMPLDCMKDRLGEIDSQVINNKWEEYESDANKARLQAIADISEAIEKRQKYDSEQAELADLRAKAEIQKQKDRDEEIRREAEAQAKREAEEEAARVKAQADEEKAKAEAAIEAGKVEKAAAEQRAKDAEEQAQRQAEEAATAERNRIEAVQKAKEDGARLRERNTQHKGKINREAVAALMEHVGMFEAPAKEIVSAIARGQIPNVSISY